jgi:hypothetical protein
MGRILVGHSVVAPPLEYIKYTAVVAPNCGQQGFVASRITCAELPWLFSLQLTARLQLLFGYAHVT